MEAPFSAVSKVDRATLEGLLGHSVRTGQHRERMLYDVQTEARGGLVEHKGVMTLASPLRFFHPSTRTRRSTALRR